MTLDIITPDKRIFQGEAKAVYFPGVDGRFEVLDHHAAMVSALQCGELKVTTPTETINFHIDGGVVEVVNNKVTVLAEGVTL
jgi:F-type H+-transporting ATPase subunit epsilon